jgi:hypothetical protein
LISVTFIVITHTKTRATKIRQKTAYPKEKEIDPLATLHVMQEQTRND